MTPSREIETSSRSDFIQLLRFLAAGLVLVSHTTFYYHERIDPSVETWHFGEIGVPVFFIVSGIVMLISASKLPAGTMGSFYFLKQRFYRIVPLYWLATSIKVFIAILAPSVINHNHFDFIHTLKSLLFIPYYNGDGEIRPIHGVGWTLHHEMFFYFVFSASILIKTNKLFFTAIIILSLQFMGSFYPQSALWQVITSPFNLYFVYGLLVGYTVSQTGGKIIHFSALISILLIIRYSKSFFPNYSISVDPLALAIGCISAFAYSLTIPRFMNFLVRLGDSSYSLYLFHPFIAPTALILIDKLVPDLYSITKISIVICFTVIAAHLVHLMIEKPLNHQIKRLFDQRHQSART